MNTEQNRLFHPDGCLSEDGLRNYLTEKGSDEFREEVLNHIEQCEFCADAIDGHNSNLNSNQYEELIRKTRKSYIELRTSSQPTSAFKITVTIISTAAAVALLITLGILFQKINIDVKDQHLSVVTNYDLLDEDFTRPKPPPVNENYTVALSEKEKSSIKPAENLRVLQESEHKSEPILKKRQPISKGEIASEKPNKNEIVTSRIVKKTLQRKGFAEFQIVFPEERVHSGYSFKDENIIIARMEEKGANAGYYLPSFRGMGTIGFINYVSNNIKYPVIAVEKGISGVVMIEFTIDINGKIINPHVTKSVDSLLDAEALRVVRTSPNWIPANIDGIPARVTLSCPVSFILQ